MEKHMPDRDGAICAIAQIFDYGITLTSGEIAEILPIFGYSPNKIHIKANELMASYVTARVMCIRHGVEPVSHKYRGIKVFRDSKYSLEDTDYNITQSQIDYYTMRKSAVIEKTKKTNL